MFFRVVVSPISRYFFGFIHRKLFTMVDSHTFTVILRTAPTASSSPDVADQRYGEHSDQDPSLQ